MTNGKEISLAAGRFSRSHISSGARNMEDETLPKSMTTGLDRALTMSVI